MGKDTEIAWCHHTFNPWHGCARVSPGCENCYAEAQGKRFGTAWGVNEPRRFFGDVHWTEPRRWNVAAAKDGERRRVFCASMADVFEDREDLAAPRARLFSLISDTPALVWLLLTKRPESADRLWRAAHVEAFAGAPPLGPTWADNVWLGTTVEDQRRAGERIPHLLSVPAAVRFLSCEPLLGPVTLAGALPRGPGDRWHVDWVIVGGESGPGARSFEIGWARDIVRQCRAAGVAPFVKQLGARAIASPAIAYPGSGTAARRLPLVSRKGGDPAEWPEDLRVREFPVVG